MDSFIWLYFRCMCDDVVSDPPLSSCRISSVTVTLTDRGFCTTLYHCDHPHKSYHFFYSENVSGYVCNHGSPSGERDTASPRGHYGERLQRDSCLKKHMKKHHPLAGDSPWRHYRRDHNIRTAGRIHHPLLRLKLASEAWPQSLGDAVSRSPLGEPWLHT